MAVGTADYTMKNLNEKTNEEIEGFVKRRLKPDESCRTA